MRGRRAGGTLAVLVAFVLGSGCASEADGEALAGGDEPSAGDPPADAGGPSLGDHWHAAFGVSICGELAPDVPTFDNAEGIHTHGDGVIHVHPFTEAGTGSDATLGLFLRDAGIDLADGELTVDGETYRDGDECDGEPASVRVARWLDVRSGDDPEIVTVDVADLVFEANGEGYLVVFAPEGDEVSPPPSTSMLDDLAGTASDTTATTRPGGGPADGDAPPLDAPASGGGVVALPGFRPVESVVEPSASDGGCGRDQLGGLDGSCYQLGSGGMGLEAVASARSELTTGEHRVALELTDDGLDAFNELADQCYQRGADCPTAQVAIVVDGVVVSAPAVTAGGFTREISITGAFDAAEADQIVAAITG